MYNVSKDNSCVNSHFRTDETSTEITCMLFIDPHPCLVTADADANICVWGVRPYYPKYHVLYRCRIPRTPTPIEEDVRLATILKEREERKSKLNDNKNNKVVIIVKILSIT